MKYTNYININTDNLLFNIKMIKKEYSFEYYILDVSNNAFNHGMYIINYINEKIDYLYVNNLDDVFLIRKFNKEIPIILNSDVDKDSVLDIINHSVILVINNLETLKMIYQLDLYDTLQVILNIDMQGVTGFKEKFEVQEAINIIDEKKKLKLVGVKAFSIDEKDYLDFQYIVNQLLRMELKLYIFNDENDKKKIKKSNAIKLDYSIYGINRQKKKLFKEDKMFRQVFTLNSKIVYIKKESKGKKVKYIGVLPYGYFMGMTDNINKVYINNKLYHIKEIHNEYMLVDIDDNIKVDEEVQIIGDNNPLESYVNSNILGLYNIYNNLPILYENEKTEKVFVY